jgi:hypothetical protein
MRGERTATMGQPIRITVGKISLNAELNDTDTAKQIIALLPLKSKANTWGDEIYFSIALETGAENQKSVVEMGEIGFWPPGSALCLFFGPTPASHGDEIRPASPVNVVGKILGDPKVLKSVKDGDPVEVFKAE